MEMLTFPPECGIKMADGGKCPIPASHRWGSVDFCCTHFDQFVTGLLDLKEAVQERRHTDIMEEYNRRTKRTSAIPGAICNAEKKKP